MSELAGKASILAIGTELTTGQITNRNAAWISERLVDLGAEVVLHETVADDRAAIAAALDRCWSVSRILFVCGGLGPTTDDFTRDCVADWLGAPLEFYSPTWEKIEKRLTQFGVVVSPSNRQQAFYPRGAEVLLNPQGTADAFVCARDGGKIWVLPGPPKEIESVWQENRVDEVLRAALPPQTQKLKLLRWDCLGKSEAALGEITETALAGSHLATGYRAHRPYIEVKVWLPETREHEVAPWIEKLEAALAPWVVARDGEDLGRTFLERLRLVCGSDTPIDFVETGTAGVLSERLSVLFREPHFRPLSQLATNLCEWATPDSVETWGREILAEADESVLTFVVAGPDPIDRTWCIGFKQDGHIESNLIHSPWKDASREGTAGPEVMDRSRRYVVEVALQSWIRWLRSVDA